LYRIRWQALDGPNGRGVIPSGSVSDSFGQYGFRSFFKPLYLLSHVVIDILQPLSEITELWMIE
jgi:hypothetical protein